MKLSGLGGFVRDLFSWMDQTRRTKKSVEALAEKLDRLSRAVERLVLQAEHEKEVNRLEREKLMSYNWTAFLRGLRTACRRQSNFLQTFAEPIGFPAA